MSIAESGVMRRLPRPFPTWGESFPGVQFATKIDGTVRIAPTAISAYWRENYGGLSRFDCRERGEIL